MAQSALKVSVQQIAILNSFSLSYFREVKRPDHHDQKACFLTYSTFTVRYFHGLISFYFSVFGSPFFPACFPILTYLVFPLNIFEFYLLISLSPNCILRHHTSLFTLFTYWSSTLIFKLRNHVVFKFPPTLVVKSYWTRHLVSDLRTV